MDKNIDLKILSERHAYDYKVINYAVPITKEEEEEMVLDIYRILTKDDKE